MQLLRAACPGVASGKMLMAVACGVQGMIILDYACDHAMDSAEEPLDLWATIEVCIGLHHGINIRHYMHCLHDDMHV